jgi:thymidine phosphorylase
MVAVLGGPKDFLADHAKHLPAAPLIRAVHADAEGFVSSIRTRELGLAVIELGGGRRVAADSIDHRVGLSQLLGKGARVDRTQPLCLIHAADEAGFNKAADIVKSAYVIGERGGEQATVLARIAG